jgi:hypothetical protein
MADRWKGRGSRLTRPRATPLNRPPPFVECDNARGYGLDDIRQFAEMFVFVGRTGMAEEASHETNLDGGGSTACDSTAHETTGAGSN